MPQAFQRIVVQILMRQNHFTRLQRIRVHREAVILRGDFHLPGFQIQDGMIAAVVAELEFVRLPAQGQADDLVAEANAEDGHAAHHVAHGLRGVLNRFRVARAVGKKHPIRV